MTKERYEEEIDVRSYETDFAGNLKAEQAMRIMEEVGEHQMADAGLPYDELVASGKTLLVNRIDTEVYKPIKKHTTIRVSSWPCETHRMIIPRRYRIIDEDGDVAVDMISQWTLVDIEKKKILKPNDADFSMFQPEELDIPMPKRDKFTREEVLNKIAEIKIAYNEIDSNGHMNNVDYLKLVQRYIPELFHGWRISSYRVNFSKEALLGETVQIYSTEPTETVMMKPIKRKKKTYKFRIKKENGLLSAELEINLVDI